MDTVQLLTLIVLAVLVFLAVTLRRSITRNAAVASPIPPTIEVTDPAVARSMLVDHADVFSNRPLAPFPVDYDAGRRRPSHSINIVPHGPLWRALRCNLSAGVLHRSRLGVVAPLHRDAVEDLVAGLSAQGQGGGVLLRDAVHTALYTISVRMCFGDGVATRDDVRAMQDTLREFFDNIVEARGLAASRVARLLHWRQWQHFGGTFDRLIGLFLPLVAARQRRRSQCGYGGGGGDDGGTIRPYVDSLLDLRVPDDDVDGARRPLTDHEMASLWKLAHLVADPELQDNLHREIADADQGDGAIADERLRDLPYLRAVIQESLRLHPPVPFIVRDVGAEDGTVARYTLMVADVGRDTGSTGAALPAASSHGSKKATKLVPAILLLLLTVAVLGRGDVGSRADEKSSDTTSPAMRSPGAPAKAR
ncbi:cytochrome P450 89A2-like [Setaria italica]|uniref:cytochrome P450 89A2-like n=1 Tax=Setaria italica TaxID=4555 RepID=UPI000BE53FB4|nr:cytochrome P450 89A2-like [Setaria italica]